MSHVYTVGEGRVKQRVKQSKIKGSFIETSKPREGGISHLQQDTASTGFYVSEERSILTVKIELLKLKPNLLACDLKDFMRK